MNTELPRKLPAWGFAGRIPGSYFPHLLFRHPVVRVILAVSVRQPAFGFAVRHIIKLCSKKKMIGINATWVIAAMAHVCFIGHR